MVVVVGKAGVRWRAVEEEVGCIDFSAATDVDLAILQ